MNYVLKEFSSILLLLVATICINAQPTDNVVAYYTFNGSANDVSGNGKHGTVWGATLISDRLGKSNAAYSFNGSDNLIYLPTDLLPTSSYFAISCWVKPAGNNFSPDTYNNQNIWDLRGQYQIALSYNEPLHPTTPNSVIFYTHSSPTSIFLTSPNNSIVPGNWYHIVCNYGDNTMELYINGQVAAIQYANEPGPVWGYNNTIGKDYNDALNRLWFYGAIDQLLLYKRKLTSTEILNIYNRELTSSEITEIQGTIKYSYDLSGNRKGKNVISLKSGRLLSKRDSINTKSYLDESKEPAFEEKIADNKVVIYPNPTRGIVKIELSGWETTNNAGIKIYDAKGILLVNLARIEFTNTIDMSSFSNGVYFLKVSIGDKISEWKIIKE